MASDPTDGSGVTNGQGDAEEEFPTTAAPSSEPESSQSKKAYDPDRDVARDRYTLVSKIMEGLRGDAVLIARHMGIAGLVADQGLRNLVKNFKVKENVSPRASEEAKELFRIGQVRGPPIQ